MKIDELFSHFVNFFQNWWIYFLMDELLLIKLDDPFFRNDELFQFVNFFPKSDKLLFIYSIKNVRFIA